MRRKQKFHSSPAPKFPLSDYDQFWQAIPRVWENVTMGNHPPMFPNQSVPPIDIPRLTGEQVILEAMKPKSRLEWTRCAYFDGRERIDFSIPVEHAEDLARTFGLKSAVFPLIINDENGHEIAKAEVLCKGFRKDYLRNRVMAMDFVKFTPFSETIVWIPVKFWGLDDMIWQFQKWDKTGSADYFTHNSEIQMYWYGDKNIPGFMSIDVEQIRPPSKTLISLRDVKLHELMKPASEWAKDHKIVEIFWEKKTKRAEADEEPQGFQKAAAKAKK